MKNKWLIALSAVGIHMSIGSVYAWSVLTAPIMRAMNISLSQTTWTFSLAILFLGLSAGFLGTFVESLGPRKSGLLSTVFFSTGLLGTAFAIYSQNIILLYLFYGCIGGIGLGIGYITPVSTLVKYFPNARGFATGLAIMGFGFASLIAAPLMQNLVANYGLTNNFIFLAYFYSVIMICSSLYLSPPPAITNIDAAHKDLKITYTKKQYTANEALKTWQFYALWFIFFINITCGIALLAVASPMAQEIIHMSPVMAASMVGIIGLMNGFGRIVWSSLSDYIGRQNTYIAFFIIEIAAFLSIAHVRNEILFLALLLIIVSCYGGGFSCMPAYISDIFGTQYLSSIHGRILTAWGLAGIAGPILLSVLYGITQGYTISLYTFAALFGVNLIVAIILKLKTSK